MNATNGKESITRVAAYGLVFNPDRQLLFCRLSAKVPWVQGKWTLPGGGVEFGEKPQDTLVREVHEESGLVVEPLGLAGVDSYVTENETQNFHNIRIVFRTRLIAGDLQNEQDGSTDLCQWFSYDEADRLPLVSLGRIGLKWAFGNVSFLERLYD